jgi:hypothetical protein
MDKIEMFVNPDFSSIYIFVSKSFKSTELNNIRIRPEDFEDVPIFNQLAIEKDNEHIKSLLEKHLKKQIK